MFKNYLKIALRILLKYKSYSFINIAGLAIGLACCIFILLYVQFERSYDSYHNDGDRIFRVCVQIRSNSFNADYPAVAFTIAPAYKENFPEVEEAIRLWRRSNCLVKCGDRSFYENRFFYADPQVFSVLTIPFVSGSPEAALAEPNSMVITEEMAEKYFGVKNPVGNIINVNSNDFKITGIVANSPENTHLKYDFIASLLTLDNWSELTNWYGTMSRTYVKLKAEADLDAFRNKIRHIEERYAEVENTGQEISYFLQPIKDIHLHSHLDFEIDPPGNPLILSIYTAIGILILLIACGNYMNLSTSRSIKRAKEVGLRKVIGAVRSQLIRQFLGESFLITFFSLLFSLLIIGFTLPMLNNIVGTEFIFSDILKKDIILILTIIVLFTELIAGCYPAFYFSRFNPYSIIKGEYGVHAKGSKLRKTLVIGQFSISTILIILTITGYKQLDYMKSVNLGFDKDHKLIIRVGSGASITDNYKTVKAEFLRHSNIMGAAVSSSVPGYGMGGWGTKVIGEEHRNQWMHGLMICSDFLREYDIQLAAGRFFREDEFSEDYGYFLINEAGVKAFGWSSPEEAIGKKLIRGYGNRTGEIIGIIKDFHYFGLQNEIPGFIVDQYTRGLRLISLTIRPENIYETLKFVENKWKELFPGIPFDYFFLDTNFDLQYRREEMLSSLFSVFAFLGIFIAGIGLLGLAAYTTEQRTKEIGIRKICGASVSSVILLLAKEFNKLVCLGIIISFPFAYICGNLWLENFAYRTNLNWLPFTATSFFVLLFSSMIVGYRALRAATTNPVDSLRYE